MAKKNEHIEDDEVRFTVEEGVETADEQPDAQQDDSTKEHLTAKLKKKIDQTSEADEAPSASLRLRDVLGGDFLWTVVRRQIWLIVLIVVIVIAYVAVRYQCQQDAIDATSPTCWRKTTVSCCTLPTSRRLSLTYPRRIEELKN